MKIAFLDRDGTINRDYPDLCWSQVKKPEILEGAIEAMNKFIIAGYKIIIITNQYIIGDGIISLSDYQSFTEMLLDELHNNGVEILDIFYCPHSKNVNCNCYKPKPGMIQAACRKYPEINLRESFYVGDSFADMELAEKCGIKFFGINLKCKNSIQKLSDMSKIQL
ncbi:HAD-IIIA family hydrolase [Fumia xinanensis]|uniref:D,D-heptose 1,7-bisphosphate phosphatase n=1 Tax=Fumia xinanensis TaxID=2763659 RepID=A0A926E4N2_9FIRM|nr:HAD-IIIA family hydrolase [Fumia xinanensis]MBC8559445.1 HAD-IIIA family hydrolase [Fumia xinanensis]